MVEWLAGNRIKGTSTERTTTTVSSPPTISTDGNYTVLTYTKDGVFVPKGSFNVEYLVVAGGAGGGSGGEPCWNYIHLKKGICDQCGSTMTNRSETPSIFIKCGCGNEVELKW